MKKAIRNAVVAVIVMAFAINASAQSTATDNVAYTLYTGSNLITLQLENMKGNYIHIAIQDKDGNLYFEEKLKGSKNLRKTYDLAALPNKEYQFKITTDKPLSTESVLTYLETEKDRPASYVESLADFIGKYDTYVQLAIMNDKGEEVKKKSIYNVKDLARVLSASDLDSGKYNIALVRGNTRYLENISLK